MTEPEIATMIEGIGDEVLHIVGLLLVIAIPMLIAYTNRNQNQRHIHPENLSAVEQVREELGFTNAYTADQQRNQTNGSTEEYSTTSSNTTQDGQQRRRRYNTDPTCPICLADMKYSTETNCGHMFCVMVATQEQMNEARLPLDRRDYCAHYLIDYYKCRQEAFPHMTLCKGKKHDYEVCEFEDYIMRMKEYEREKRLLQRAKRKRLTAEREELVA